MSFTLLLPGPMIKRPNDHVTLMVSFWAFFDPGLDSWHFQNAFVKIHQQWKLLKWLRDSWFTTREKVHKVEESDICVGQLQGTKYVSLLFIYG